MKSVICIRPADSLRFVMGQNQPNDVAVKPPEFTTKQFAGLMAGASVGSMFEWYDFYLAATAAAAVWPRIFFPATLDPAVALAVSVMSVGLAYLARPIGAVIFGHFADRYGRRATLVANLLTMGIASVGTAVLPPYVSAGFLSLIMLFAMRFLIGIGLGGETGGAFSWIAEARPNAKHRGFWISWPTAVLTLGKMLSIFAFFLAAYYLTNAEYVAWGWRVPFAVGALLLAVAVIIRIKISESPMFQQLMSKRQVLKYPAFQVMREHGRKIFTLLWLNAYVTATGAFVILPYSVSYLVRLGMNEAFSNLSVTVGTAVAFFTVLLGAYISDYVGRLRTIRIGAVLTIVSLYPYFWLLQTLNPVLIVAAQALLYGIHSSTLGANSAVYAESFPTKYRSSGSGLAYQLAGLVAGLLVALLLPLLLVTYGVLGSWQPIAWAVIILTIVAIVASYFVKETRGSTLE